MDPITLGLIAMGVGGAVKVGSDLFDNTGSRQADLMHQQANLKRAALDETMSRALGQQTQLLSSTKARMAGTGFDAASGSFTGYIHAMATQFDLQNRYARSAGEKSAALIDQGADIMADPTTRILKGLGDAAGTGASLAGMFKMQSEEPQVFTTTGKSSVFAGSGLG